MANFDSKLEALVTGTLVFPLTSHATLALEQVGIIMFNNFTMFNSDDFLELKYVNPSDALPISFLCPNLCVEPSVIVDFTVTTCTALRTLTPHAYDPTDTSTSVWENDVFCMWERDGFPAFLAGSTVRPLP